MGGVTWTRVQGLGAALLLLVGAAACRERASSVQYDGPYAKEVRDAIPRIEQASGLRFKRPPTVEARSRDQVRAFLERKFEEDKPAKELLAQGAAYKRLGLLPDTMDVRATMLDLLGEQIVGFYDPDTKVLYVVEGSAPEMLTTIITHELVHALQDQYVALDSIQRLTGDNDRAMAAQAVIEGMAVYDQMQAMLGGGDIASRLPGGWDRIRETIRDQSATMPQFASAPLLLQETLLFPYLSGAEFVRRLDALGDSAILRRMPQSTEQVLHAAAYDAPADPPTRVILPAPRVGTTAYENNLGEFETRLFVYQHLRDLGIAARAAKGWDGDRYVHVTTPGGDGIAWVVVFDSPFDAGEFFDAVDQVIMRREPRARPGAQRETDRSYTGGGRTRRVVAADVQGRPAVMYVDMPAGTSTDVVDLGRVRLEEAPPASGVAP